MPLLVALSWSGEKALDEVPPIGNLIDFGLDTRIEYEHRVAEYEYEKGRMPRLGRILKDY